MNRLLISLVLALTGVFYTATSEAGLFELGTGFYINRNNYGDGSYTLSRRYSFSVGYYFTQDSELEFSFQDSTTHTYVPSVQDVTFHDQVFSLDLDYYLLSEEYVVRPYVKGGVGQLNRDASGVYAGGSSPPRRTDQLTAILGGGVKAKITERFGLKAEVSSYLSGAQISTWKDNISITIGASLYL